MHSTKCLDNGTHHICIVFCSIYSLRSSQQFFSYVGMGLPGLNKYQAGINISCSWTQRSAMGEAGTRNRSISNQALDH